MRINRSAILALSALGVFAIGLAAIILWPVRAPAPRGGRGGDDGPVPVLVAEATRHDVPLEIDSIGTVQAFNMVTIHSEVDGRLIALKFKDGQMVNAGDVLAQIDPTIYKAQFDQAVAKKKQDEANLANAQRDLERYLNLAKTEYAPQQQADTQRAVVDQIVAQIAADQAAIDNAKAYLDRTTITAPIAGRTGIRQVDEGNLVHASDPTGLVSVAQLQPISVIVTLPQQQLVDIMAALAKDGIAVEARDNAAKQSVMDRGTIDVIDNAIDSTTGTIKLKAKFPNDAQKLWPGQFVTVRLKTGVIKDALTIPAVAVRQGPDGSFAYVLSDDSKAIVRPITITRQTSTEAIIAEGLQPGERVITTGFNRLSDGAAVRADTETAPATPASPSPPKGKNRNKSQNGQSSTAQ